MSARQPEPERLTPERLEEIRARAEAATPGPWEHLAEYGPVFVGYLQGEHLRGVGDLDFGVGDDATADEEFTLHAREDVPALIAEIDRLRAEAAASRTAVLDEAAERVRARCPRHGHLLPSFDDCRCEAATELDELAAEARAAQTGGESGE